MLIISFAFFVLGIFAFMDTLFNHGSTFQWFTSAVLIFMSLWLYIRVRTFKSLKNMEKLEAQNTEAQEQTTQFSQPPASRKKEPEKVHS